MTYSEARRQAREEAIEEARRNDEMEDRTERKLRRFQRATVVLGTLLALTVIAIVPFLAGHSLHDHWEAIGKYLVMFAMGLLSAFMGSAGLTFGLWRYLRDIQDIHKKYAPPLSRHRTGSRSAQ